MEDLLDHEYLGNSTLRWALALGVAAAVFAGLLLIKRLVVGRLGKLSERTTTQYDDVVLRVIDSTRVLTLLMAAIAAGARSLVLPAEGALWLGRAVVVVLAVQAGLWVTTAVKLVIQARQEHDSSMPGARTFSAAAAFITNLVVWSVIVLLVLSNFGIEITALVAGLGIGGIAAALAVQNTLGDLFAAFSIYTDRPFDIGDFIAVDDFMGNVDRIGWRTTHLRSLGGEMLVMANSDLAKSRIRNFKRMSERRVVMNFGVEYGTPAAKLAWIPKFVRETIEGIEGLRFDRSHFKGYGDSSLDFETVFFVTSPDYNAYMDRQQQLLLTIYERFENDEIGFAFPTRTMHVYRHLEAPAEEGAEEDAQAEAEEGSQVRKAR